MDKRRKKLQGILKEKGLNGFIVTNPFNIFYLTGFRGFSQAEREAILIVTTKKATLVTTRLYQQEAQQLKSKSLDIKIAAERNKINEYIKAALTLRETIRGLTPKIGFEQHDLKVTEFLEFRKILKGAKLIPTKNLIENLRQVKTEDEIKKIERAQKISQKSFGELLKTIKPGQTEQEIAEKLLKIIKTLGGQGLAFESIIAFGLNSSKPHHITGRRRLTKNDILLLDFGTKYKDYCADLTRTIFLGKSKDEQANIWHHVFKAQQQAINKIEHGLKSAEAFDAANNHFKKHKLEKYFLHSLGHGIGLEVHEKPHVGPPIQTRLGIGRQVRFDEKETLEEGMVFSVEPGLYFPNWGGVRLEDIVTIKGGKAKVLGKTSQFIEL